MKLGGPKTVVSGRPRREVRRVTATTAAGRQCATYPRICAAAGTTRTRASRGRASRAKAVWYPAGTGAASGAGPLRTGPGPYAGDPSLMGVGCVVTQRYIY